MSNIDEQTQLCTTCGIVKFISLFPKWRLKCKACKSVENSARLKERYATDAKFIKRTKERAATWQRENAERTNEYHRRRHAKKILENDAKYVSKIDDAQRRYRKSDKGKATAAAFNKRYVVSGKDKKQRAVRYQKPESRASLLVAGARNRALKTDVQFNITFDDVYPTILAGTCPKTGFTFDLSPHVDLRRHPLAPSIDRIDSLKGYVRGNVQIVCNWYNLAKHELSEIEMLAFCKAVVDKVSTKT